MNTGSLGSVEEEGKRFEEVVLLSSGWYTAVRIQICNPTFDPKKYSITFSTRRQNIPLGHWYTILNRVL